jgi:hypothetical protein
MRYGSPEYLPWQLRKCAQCDADIIAPEYLSDHRVRNVWSCEPCEYQFEDMIYLSRGAADAE